MATDDRAPKPRKMASEAFQRRLQNEMEQAPPGTLEGFMAAHGGLTPIQFAVAQLSAAEQEVIRQQRPDLCPPRPEAVGLQRRMKTSTECADAVRAAENEATVVTVLRGFVEALDPRVVAALPDNCQEALADEKDGLQAAAVTLVRASLSYRGAREIGQLLQQIADTYAVASVKVSRLRDARPRR